MTLYRRGCPFAQEACPLRPQRTDRNSLPSSGFCLWPVALCIDSPVSKSRWLFSHQTSQVIYPVDPIECHLDSFFMHCSPKVIVCHHRSMEQPIDCASRWCIALSRSAHRLTRAMSHLPPSAPRDFDAMPVSFLSITQPQRYCRSLNAVIRAPRRKNRTLGRDATTR